MRVIRSALVGIFLVALAGVGSLLATGALRFVSAPVPSFDALSPPNPAAAASSRPVLAAASMVSTSSSEIVAVASQADQKMTVVDTATGKVSTSFDLGIPPKAMTLAPNAQTAWVFSSKPGESEFVTVDLVKGSRKGRKRLHDNPSAAAFSTDGRRAYVALGGGNDSPPVPSSIVFLDTSNDAEFGHVDVGEQGPGVQILRRLVAVGVAPGPSGDVIYAAGQLSGTVWALDAGSGQILQQIEVGGGPIIVLPDTPHQRVYIVADTIDELVAVDMTTQTVVNRLRLPGSPTGASIGPDGTLYIAGGDAGELWPVDPSMTNVGKAIAVGSQPAGLAVSLDGTRVYVADRGDSTLVSVDLRTKQINSRIPVGKDPVAVVVAPSAPPAGSTPTATPVAATSPTATPTLAPTATPLPEGASPPEHLPAGLVSDTFVPDADFPVTFAFAPDGTVLYNELKTGRIRVVRNGQLLPDPFYQFVVAGEPETGLIGLTLDPDFATNHYVYVYYTSVPEGQSNGGPNGPNEVVRLTDVDDRGTDLTPILPDLPSGPVHNSGTLRFGPDGKLYVSIGDNEQGSNAQDLGTLAGKILRVNSDGSLPPDNPFVGQEGKQPAVWAYGLRNPFSFDFDPVSHGLLGINDGPGDNDELDLFVRGGNYGWPPTGYKYQSAIVDPLAVLNPSIDPTGVTFYTGDQIPDWKNDLFYCIFHTRQMRRVRLAPESRDRIVFEEVVKNGCSINVATGPDGALYYSDQQGIYRIHRVDATNLLPSVSNTAVVPATPGPQGPSPARVAPTPTSRALPAGTRPEDRDINISLTEWKLQPSRTRVPAGQIRFLAENSGTTPHALQIVGQGVDVSTDTFSPGDSRSITVQLPRGEYQLVCPVPGHELQGMSATLTVVDQ